MRIPPLRLDPHLAVPADVLRRAVLQRVRRRHDGRCRGSARWFDQYVVDGIVNLRRLADEAGVVRRRAARQVRRRRRGERRRPSSTQDLGAAVRAPQTGRIRMYVTVLMVAVALGLAGAIIVVLSMTSTWHGRLARAAFEARHGRDARATESIWTS